MKNLNLILVVLFSFLGLFLFVFPTVAMAQQCPYLCLPAADCQNQGGVIRAEFECGTGNFCCQVNAPETPAAGVVNLGKLGGLLGFGPWGKLGAKKEVTSSARALTTVISNAIGIMTVIAGIWFIFQFIIGALSIMSASGDPKKMEEATGKIRVAIISLVVVVAAYALMSLLGKILGLNFLSPVGLIEKLKP